MARKPSRAFSSMEMLAVAKFGPSTTTEFTVMSEPSSKLTSPASHWVFTPRSRTSMSIPRPPTRGLIRTIGSAGCTVPVPFPVGSVGQPPSTGAARRRTRATRGREGRVMGVPLSVRAVGTVGRRSWEGTGRDSGTEAQFIKGIRL